MKTFRDVWVWGMVGVLLAGCLSEPVRTPQQAIIQLNLTLAASYRQIADGVKGGAISLKERDSIVPKLDRLSADVDSAQKMLDLGDLKSAEVRIKLVNSALLELTQKINEKRSK